MSTTGTDQALTPLKPNPEETWQFLSAMKPPPYRLHGIYRERGQLPDPLPNWWYLRTDKASGKKIPAQMHNVLAKSREDVAKFLNECHAAQLGAYYAINRGTLKYPKKLSDADITSVHFLHADLDFKDVPPEILAAPEAERVAWYEQQKIDLRVRVLYEFKEKFGKEPTYMADSGGGLQVLLMLEEPFVLDGEEGRTADHIAGHNKALATLFPEADATPDVSRVFRLPGSVNWPAKNKRERGRVPALAKTVTPFNAGSVFSLDEMPHVSVVSDNAVDAAVEFSSPPAIIKDLAEHIDPRILKDGRVAQLCKIAAQGWDEDNPKTGDTSPGPNCPEGLNANRSEWVMQFVAFSVRTGINFDVIRNVLLDDGWAVSAHILDQGDPESYAQRQIQRALDDGAVFGEWLPKEEAPTAWEPRGIAPIPNDLQPRPWLVPGLLLDRQITLLSAHGGMGKSMLALQLGIMVATGENWFGWSPARQGRVLFVCSEDDIDEIRRRVLGASMQMGIDPEVLVGQFDNIDARPLVTFDPEKGLQLSLANRDALSNMAQDYDLLILDPLIEMQIGLNENDNAQMDLLAKTVRGIARRTNIPILLVHHHRKSGTGGNQDSARGAGSLTAAVRFHLTLVEDEDGVRKLQGAKANYSAKHGDVLLSMESVTLPNGDKVGVFVQPPDAEIVAEADVLKAVATAYDERSPFRASFHAKKEQRLDCHIAKHWKVLPEDAKSMVMRLLEEGKIADEAYKKPNGKKSYRLRVPGQVWQEDGLE